MQGPPAAAVFNNQMEEPMLTDLDKKFLRIAYDEAKAGLDEGGCPIGSVVVRDGQAVEAAERAEQEVAVVVDAVIRGEQHRVDLVRGHVAAQFGDSPGVLGRRERPGQGRARERLRPGCLESG